MGAERCPIIWLVSCERKVTQRKQNYGATIAETLFLRTPVRVILNGELRASHVKDLFCEAKFTLDTAKNYIPTTVT